ncbi:MAG: hypothetical protein ABW041_00320 [Dehalococcoides mccartyi]|nr:hypothetical protein DMOBY_06050 [Dehalococcoides mccartyi]
MSPSDIGYILGYGFGIFVVLMIIIAVKKLIANIIKGYKGE